MTYTSSRFTLLKGNCPICNGEHKSCKQNDELIHCRSFFDPPQGYRSVGEDKIGFAMYAPAKERSNNFDLDAYRANREARLAKQARQYQQALKAMPSLEERDRHIREKAQNFTKTETRKLTKPQNTDLLRRGLTQDEINNALSKHWLFALDGGYGIAAYDPISQLLCGAQRANDDRTKKYTWGVFTGQNKLQETGENPIFVWVSPDFDSSKPYQIKFCEGALKSLIRAFFEWRSDTQVIMIGGAGGIFGSNSLERLLRAYPDATSHTLLPDADSQNIKKLNLYRAYGKLAAAIPSLKFADWQQWRGGKDCDETYGTNAFNGYELRSPDDWLSFFEELRAKKQDDLLFLNWQKNKAFTPDIRVNNKAVFDTIPIPQINTIITVRSDFGTQKTRGMLRHLKHWHKQGYKVILAGFRNALLMQTINVWSEVLPNLMMMKVDPTYIRMAGQHLALCLDQLTRNKCKPQDFDKSILVIDEADQVELHALMGGTLKDNRSEVFALFCEMIRRADVIYLMSAGLSDATVKFIQDIRGDRFTKVVKYQNDFVNRQKFTIVDDVVNPHTGAVTSAKSVLKTKLLATKGNIFIADDSQNDLEGIDKELTKLGKDTFRYDSKTSDSEAGRDFAANPNIVTGDLGISPSGNCGISITKEDHFEAVFAISNGVLDVDSFLQMPMRVRDKSVTRYLAVPEKCEGYSNRTKPKMPDEVMGLMNDFVLDFGNLSIQGLPVEQRLNELVNDLSSHALNALQFRRYAELQAALNYEKANFKKCLEWRLNDLGHSFKRWENGFSNNDVIVQILANKEEIKFEECQKIVDSPDVSISEAKAIMQADKPYEERLKATKAIIKDNLPKIEKSELWSADFIKLTRYDDRDLLKRLDLRYLANNPDVAKSKAVDNLAYLMQLQDLISLQDVRSPLPFLTAARDVGLLDLMNYEGDDIHKEHHKIIDICKAAKKKVNARRLGIFQGKKESNMQFISRLLAKLGYGTKGRYIKATKTYFYQVRDIARAKIEMFQLDRAMTVLGVKLRDLPHDEFKKCFDDENKQIIFKFSEFCDEFGLEAMLKICYGKAKNLSHLALIDVQLQLFFASADEGFSELSEAIDTRYRYYQSSKKQHDFEQILEQKNSMVEMAKNQTEQRINQDHPLPISINKFEGEGDPKMGIQNQGVKAAVIKPVAIAPSAPKTPNAPSPNNKPSNKPTQPPKNIQPVDPYELRLKAYQRGWDGSPFSLMQYAY